MVLEALPWIQRLRLDKPNFVLLTSNNPSLYLLSRIIGPSHEDSLQSIRRTSRGIANAANLESRKLSVDPSLLYQNMISDFLVCSIRSSLLDYSLWNVKTKRILFVFLTRPVWLDCSAKLHFNQLVSHFKPISAHFGSISTEFWIRNWEQRVVRICHSQIISTFDGVISQMACHVGIASFKD